MESLQILVANAPDWVTRLNELHAQIEQRQLDLAKFEDTHPQSSARSLRNKGSTESLKPPDDGVAYSPISPHPLAQTPAQPPAQATSNPGSDPKTPSSIQRQTKEIAATAQRRARAVLRKRQKTESMISAEGMVTAYRTRSLIIVYYDSYVQSFFEELVKFVSAQRNMMRKAKMAAKVAQIKRLAELEMPDDDEDDDDDDDILRPGNTPIAADPKLAVRTSNVDTTAELKLRYMSTRLMGPTSRIPGTGYVHMRGAETGLGMIPNSLSRGFGSGEPEGSDFYDELDRGLEFVQGMCERAAHQFLRDGECTEEIEKIKLRLEQTQEAAQQEMERLQKEDPEGLGDSSAMKARSYRPLSMRRDPGASAPSKKKAPPNIDDEGIEDM
ncbi:hypothetical protein BX600DRAFT_543922 [Xylariales sp. PMI_506]|nr:hypothetical protein BX600DRAFT_543922 [Xylariales sp. PMI_506]